ncbi:MAG: ABC transporter ATP-binding protein [Clostridia bacterium]
MKKYIEIKNLTKSINKHVIISDINLELQRGKIYGFVGKNGSGKSTLFKVIAGLLVPTQGTVKVDNVDIFAKNVFPNSMRAIIETPNFIDEMSGLENLMFLASLNKGTTQKVIEDLLKKLDLFDKKDIKVSKYSLGMKQKLGIIQAIMEDPIAIILDEPFNTLDEETVSIVRNILLEEKKNGKVILLASHIKEDIEILADQIYTMKDGKII